MHCGAPWSNWLLDFVFHCAGAAREARSEDDLAVVLADWTVKFRWAVYLWMTNSFKAVLESYIELSKLYLALIILLGILVRTFSRYSALFR